MSDFTKALRRTLGHEGGVSNHRSDRGGFTVLGITRRDHPDWRGWPILEARGADAPELRAAAAELYKARYWDRFDGDSLASQPVAEKLFDVAVNMGVGRAVTILQQALNALNRNGRSWPDVAEDGDMGPRTREALAACLARQDERHLLRVMNVLQGSYYLAIAKRDSSQEEFIRGWFARVFDIAV